VPICDRPQHRDGSLFSLPVSVRAHAERVEIIVEIECERGPRGEIEPVEIELCAAFLARPRDCVRPGVPWLVDRRVIEAPHVPFGWRRATSPDVGDEMTRPAERRDGSFRYLDPVVTWSTPVTPSRLSSGRHMLCRRALRFSPSLRLSYNFSRIIAPTYCLFSVIF